MTPGTAEPAPLALRVHEVAAMLDLCELTIRRRCDARSAPCANAYKEGQTWRIPTADFCAYLAERNIPIPASLKPAAA